MSKVFIIILNWNGLEDTIECLESLRKIPYPNYEVIVVDNGSKGNDAQVLESSPYDQIRNTNL
jgi:GT2 family glycosyltransferase